MEATEQKTKKEEIQKLQFRTAILEDKLQEIETKKPKLTEQEKREGWFIYEGKKVRRG